MTVLAGGPLSFGYDVHYHFWYSGFDASSFDRNMRRDASPETRIFAFVAPLLFRTDKFGLLTENPEAPEEIPPRRWAQSHGDGAPTGRSG